MIDVEPGSARAEALATHGTFALRDDGKNLLCNIAVVGDVGVGKKCLLKRYADDIFSEIPLIDTPIAVVKREISNKKIKLRLITAGVSSTDDKLWWWDKEYLCGISGTVLCFSLTDRDSFNHLKFYISDIRNYPRRFSNPNIIICGNKADLDSARVITTAEAQAFAIAEGVQYMETSAVTGAGVEDAFNMLVNLELIKMQRDIGTEFLFDQIPELSTLTLEQREQLCTDYIARCNNDSDLLGAGLRKDNAVGKVLAVHFGTIFSKFGKTSDQRRIVAAIEQTKQMAIETTVTAQTDLSPH